MLLIREATLVDGSTVDVRITGGSIEQVGPPSTLGARAREDVLQADGYLLLPAPVEPHAHLDKAFTADDVDAPAGDLNAAVAAWHTHRAALDADEIAGRARSAALLAARRGVAAIRTHADVGPGIELRAVEALLRVRDELRERIDLQVVALVYPLTGEPGAANRDRLRAAVEMGVDVIGGAPHLDPDPDGHMRFCLDTARDAGLPVDLHMDEHLGDGVDLQSLAASVSNGFPCAVTASHCVSLGMREPAVQHAVARAVAAARIAVVTCPATNLYLQGRDHPSATPRGLTALAALRSTGAVVAGGGDNVQDPFNPMGACDPLQTAQLLVLAGHLAPDEAWTAVSDHSRAAMGLEAVTVMPGSRAELVAVRAASLREALGTCTPDRIVIRGDRVVHRTRVIEEEPALA